MDDEHYQSSGEGAKPTEAIEVDDSPDLGHSMSNHAHTKSQVNAAIDAGGNAAEDQANLDRLADQLIKNMAANPAGGADTAQEQGEFRELIRRMAAQTGDFGNIEDSSATPDQAPVTEVTQEARAAKEQAWEGAQNFFRKPSQQPDEPKN